MPSLISPIAAAPVPVVASGEGVGACVGSGVAGTGVGSGVGVCVGGIVVGCAVGVGVVLAHPVMPRTTHKTIAPRSVFFMLISPFCGL